MKTRPLALAIVPTFLLILVGGVGLGTGCDSSTVLSGTSPPVEDMAGADLANPGGGCGLVTCQSANATCGLIGDGCGGTIDCGSCASPATCGGGGVQFQCGGTSACTPISAAQACSALGANCGEASDGCGSTVSCGSCAAGQTCGGGGTAFQCGSGGGGTCTPLTCAMLGSNCGTIGDGCGGTLSCGTCATGMSCGAGGVAGVCGTTTCTPRTCAQAGATCGYVGDGCGGIIGGAGGPGCGSCTSPMICGGGGMAGVATAWLLDGTHDVTLFEARETIGGNVRTLSVQAEGRTWAVDMGAQYFHPVTRNIFSKYFDLTLLVV